MSQILTAQDARELFILPTNPLYDEVVKGIKQAALTRRSTFYTVPKKWAELVNDTVECLETGGFIVEAIARTLPQHESYPFLINVVWR
jgi:hypothetical protein